MKHLQTRSQLQVRSQCRRNSCRTRTGAGPQSLVIGDGASWPMAHLFSCETTSASASSRNAPVAALWTSTSSGLKNSQSSLSIPETEKSSIGIDFGIKLSPHDAFPQLASLKVPSMHSMSIMKSCTNGKTEKRTLRASNRAHILYLTLVRPGGRGSEIQRDAFAAELLDVSFAQSLVRQMAKTSWFPIIHIDSRTTSVSLASPLELALFIPLTSWVLV